MLKKFRLQLNYSRWVQSSWIGLLLTSLIIIPTQLSTNYFDSLAFPHIFFLSLVALGFSFLLIFNNGFKNISPLVGIGLVLLFLSYFVSIAISGNPISALTGDTQRFTGAISMFSLIVILIFHSNITIDKTRQLINSICSITALITLLGVLQQWNLISLPGAGGSGSTLGNIDFLSAWIGTTIPLFLFLLEKNLSPKNILIIGEIFLSIYLLIVLDVKQGWVDLALSVAFSLIYLNRSRIQGLNLSKKNYFWIFGLAGFLWIELVLLVPFQKTKVPLIGSDPNVQIRTQYWLAGIKTFFHSLLFGVGPDNYGNYYQQYRTLASVLREERIASNDAHSALFQTLATLGLFGSISFLVILILLVRSIYVNYYKYPLDRKFLYFTTSFFVIYSTNAMISPITLPHKYIFWALVGLILGLAFNPVKQKFSDVEIESDEISENDEDANFRILDALRKFDANKLLRPLVLITSILSIVVITFFSIAQFKFILTINDLKGNAKSERVMNYQHSSMFPCTYYYVTEQTIANQNSLGKVVKTAQNEIKNNPRCIDAHLTLAKIYFANNDAAHLGWEIKALMEMAPANRDVLGLVGEVATKLGDRNLLGALHNQEVKLGFLK